MKKCIAFALRWGATPVLAMATFQIAEHFVGREATLIAAAGFLGMCVGALIVDAANRNG